MFEQLDELLGRYEEMNRQLQDPAIAGDGAKFQKIMKEQGAITPLVNAYSEYKKYDELQEKLAATLKSAIPPFEKAFNVSKNNDVKQVCADYLKRLYFIFRSESPENQAKHEFYDAFLKGE